MCSYIAATPYTKIMAVSSLSSSLLQLLQRILHKSECVLSNHWFLVYIYTYINQTIWCCQKKKTIQLDSGHHHLTGIISYHFDHVLVTWFIQLAFEVTHGSGTSHVGCKAQLSTCQGGQLLYGAFEETPTLYKDRPQCNCGFKKMTTRSDLPDLASNLYQRVGFEGPTTDQTKTIQILLQARPLSHKELQCDLASEEGSCRRGLQLQQLRERDFQLTWSKHEQRSGEVEVDVLGTVQQGLATHLHEWLKKIPTKSYKTPSTCNPWNLNGQIDQNELFGPTTKNQPFCQVAKTTNKWAADMPTRRARNHQKGATVAWDFSKL